MAEKTVQQATPLFLIAPPRSGTTILARLLNAHPRILLTNETAVFLQLGEMIGKSRQGVRAGLLFGKEYHKLWASHLEKNAKRLIEDYYTDIALHERKARLTYWGEKHPHLYAHLPLIQSLYPQAMYIYVLRDPRDAACSIAKMNRVAIPEALQTWKQFSDPYEQFADELPAQRLIRVRYEDLVQDYTGVVQQILSRLSLSMPLKQRLFIVRHKDANAHAAPQRLEPRVNYGQTSRERWRRDMNEEEQAQALELLGGFLRKYGYEGGDAS